MDFAPDKELDNQKALQLIRKIVACGERIIWSSHVKERMKERKYSSDDVMYILSRGDIVSKEFHAETQTWRYNIRGDDLDGNDGGVVTAIIKPTAIVVITVLS